MEQTGLKKELLEILVKAAERAVRAQKPVQEIQDNLTSVAEMAPAAIEFFQDLPEEQQTPEQWKHQIDGWQATVGDIIRIEAGALILSDNFTSAVYSTASVTNTATQYITLSNFEPTPRMQAAQARIDVIQRRRPLLEEARTLIRQLGLDRAPGGQRSALTILNTAAKTLGTGVPSALVTLRDSIWAAISQLNTRKPEQEAASGMEMLASIGRQCKKPHLDPGYFDRLAVDGAALIKLLSGGKDKVIPPERVSDLFDKGLVFLNAVLSGVDSTPLRTRGGSPRHKRDGG